MNTAAPTAWRGPVAFIVLGTLVVETLMVLTDMGPNLLLVAALCILAGTSIWVAMSVFGVSVDAAPLPPVSIGDPTARPDSRLSSLRSDLAYGRHNDRTAERMYVSLVELIDDRLTASHGIDRKADPDAALALMGPELNAFVADDAQAARLARPRDLVAIISLIENI